jgi:hypothetical protein
MVFQRPSTVTGLTSPYGYKGGFLSSAQNYIDEQFPNLMNINGDNIITGATTFNSLVTFNANWVGNFGDYQVNDGTLRVTGGGGFTVDSASYANLFGINVISGGTTISGNTTISGPCSITNTLTAGGTTDFSGHTTLAGTTLLTGPTTLDGVTNVTGAITFTNTPNVTNTVMQIQGNGNGALDVFNGSLSLGPNLSYYQSTRFLGGISTYTIDASGKDSILICDTLSGPLTITLPPATGSGRILTFKASGFGGSNNVTIAASGGGNSIDAASTLVISSNYGTYTLIDFASLFWGVI